MTKLEYLKESPSQTAGPYVHIGCTPNFIGNTGIFKEDLGARMVNLQTKGQRITIKGRVFDGTGTPLKDAMLEIWQADSEGLFNSPSETRGKADPHFTGWGRQPVNLESGEFCFQTVKPGSVPFPDGRTQAPHINFWIVARGINIGLNTRMYFPEEDEANAVDPVLGRIEHRVRVSTLIAKQSGDTYTFDIYIQGENETVFFDI
ncbi:MULTISPECIES: protocatechuate 3,4-dioxygenase subunit alpha [unclassified Pseudovibrio]|uniref:protocatechuate 3,4-dioxygenase subunit alpha n=1 Tax=unclassified Pseudovibrio TaxID=2627060 RepID=UPI0007AEE1B4|nr:MULTISPECIES: protocatechuate 3,4-dioxygenase subunit alpha [unclassified Pseudovibrio]KZL01343.1 Protocatechuate 3,4-dioxygenase alpha chain [Pseudovibrio sp. W74]KZL08945.1 Protocatechuate 3,4-dioxygenase alpha chain [Pseudovibrio sp. Ad14]